MYIITLPFHPSNCEVKILTITKTLHLLCYKDIAAVQRNDNNAIW